MKTLNKENLNKWLTNGLKFVAPTLAVFFGQLAMGVSWQLAWPIALLAFYQSLMDYFGKLDKQI